MDLCGELHTVDVAIAHAVWPKDLAVCLRPGRHVRNDGRPARSMAMSDNGLLSAGRAGLKDTRRGGSRG